MDPAAPPRYTERLWVPLWWWPAAALVAGLLGAEIHGGYAGVRAWLPYVVLALIAAVALLVPARATVRVDGGEFRAADAHLPIQHIAQVRMLQRAALRRLLGRDADPAAYTVVRGYIPTAVFVRLEDPEDDTPYWVVSTRHPDRLLLALAAAGAPVAPAAGPSS